MKLGAIAATKVPTLKNVIAVMYIDRVENRCSKNPVMGITMAIVNI